MKGVARATMVVLAILVFNVERGQSTVTCQQVVSYVTPCFSYIVRGTGSPASECCSGVSGLAQLTRFTEDRRAACQCLKDVATRYQDIRDDTAAGLPAACRVQISVPISRSIDCNSIQ